MVGADVGEDDRDEAETEVCPAVDDEELSEPHPLSARPIRTRTAGPERGEVTGGL